VMPPMLQETDGFGRDMPVLWIRQASPLIDLLPNERTQNAFRLKVARAEIFRV
jgi:hypothetical protein